MAGKANKKAFTEHTLVRLRPPKAGRIEIGDALAPGLVLRITERGVKSWSVIYKVPGERGVSPTGRPLRGKQHRVTLGQHPAVGLKKAREEARKIVEAALEGCDLRSARREVNLLRHTNSVKSVSKRMVELAKKQIESWEKIEQTLEAHVWPRWGARPITDVTRGDVHELLDDLVSENKKGTAREVRKHLSRLFNYAADKELISANPIARMVRRDLEREVSERALSDEELRVVWSATGQMSYPFGSALRLLLLTGQRKSDWGTARRSEIDAGDRLLSIPMKRYKSRRGHVVPLTVPAWEVVESLPAWKDNDYFLFSTTGGKSAISGWSKAKARLDRLSLAALREGREDPEAVLEEFDIHDLRRTCETRLARLGFNQEVRDAVLGHAKEGLQRTYNKYDYLDEKRAALTAYAEHVMRIVS